MNNPKLSEEGIQEPAMMHPFVKEEDDSYCAVCGGNDIAPCHSEEPAMQDGKQELPAKIARWKWLENEDGVFYMERWGGGGWVRYEDHAKASAALHETIATLRAEATKAAEESHELFKATFAVAEQARAELATERELVRDLKEVVKEYEADHGCELYDEGHGGCRNCIRARKLLELPEPADTPMEEK